jgi:protein gp37
VSKTKIEWTDATWNPVTGCSEVSAGCRNCYAKFMALRLQKKGLPKYRNGFDVTLHESVLEEPLKWKKPCMAFTCSMGDLFHEEVPQDFIDRVMGACGTAWQHTYQILTKRPKRMAAYFNTRIDLPDNIWVGTTVEVASVKFRLNELRNIDALMRFVSFEPLLGDLGELDLSGIGWVIAGGESGIGARPMKPEWVRSVRDQAKAAGVPFFFKQWGAWGPDGVGRPKKANGAELDGRTWKEMPA